MKIDFRILERASILEIIPLLSKLNTKTPKELLVNRVLEMADLPHYECVALYVNDILIGISGLWYTTRHYIGKTVETDHVFIEEEFRGHKLGKQFFDWIQEHVQHKGCEAIELNAYTNNVKSHKFYHNEGYNIYGFHFLKVVRKDTDFY
jgi:GNAT superfamily N-acetyltransferase